MRSLSERGEEFAIDRVFDVRQKQIPRCARDDGPSGDFEMARYPILVTCVNLRVSAADLSEFPNAGVTESFRNTQSQKRTA
jgi:hypothetical protein